MAVGLAVVGRTDGAAALLGAVPPPGTAGAEEPDGGVLVRWQMHADGVLTLEVTDGGAATR
ncbi:hypothetical protein AB0E96_40945, partial [Kitasatospora sp. NPDC036755]